MDGAIKGFRRVKTVCGFKMLMFNVWDDEDDDTECYDTDTPADIQENLKSVVMEEKQRFLDQLLDHYNSPSNEMKNDLIVVIKVIVPHLYEKYGGNHAIMQVLEQTSNLRSETLALRRFRDNIVEEMKKVKYHWETIDVFQSILEVLPNVDDNSEKTSINNAIEWGQRLRRMRIFLLKEEKERKATAPNFEFVQPPSDAWRGRRWCEGLYFAKEDACNQNVTENIPSKKFITEVAEFSGDYEDINHNIGDVISFLEEGHWREERNNKMKVALGPLKEYLRECTHVTMGLSWTMEESIYVRLGDWAFIPEMKIERKGYKGDFPIGKKSEHAYWALAVFYESKACASSDDSTSSVSS